MKKILIAAISAMTLCGCSVATDKSMEVATDVKYEVLVDNMNDTELDAILLFNLGISKIGDSDKLYIFDDKQIKDAPKNIDALYERLIYPTESFDRLVELGKERNLFSHLEPGKLDEYYCNEGYEIFIREDYKRKTNIAYILKDKLNVGGFPIRDDSNFHILEATKDKVIFGGSKIIYEIEIDTLDCEKYRLPDDFIALSLINNNDFYGSYIEKDSEKMYIYKYNIQTEDSIQREVDVQGLLKLEKLAMHEDKLVALCTLKDTYKPVLLYFDKDFNIIEKKELLIESPNGSVTSFYDGKNFKQYKNRLYGYFGLDGQHVDDLVIIDIPTGELLFQAEVDHDKTGMYLANITYLIPDSEELIMLPQYDIGVNH